MEFELSELEQQFRLSWREFDPNRYSEYLSQTSAGHRCELLARLLAAELEYAYQPPARLQEETTVNGDADERVQPTVHLFMLRFPEISSNDEIVIRLAVLEYALRLRHESVPPNPDSYVSLCSQSQDRLLKLLRLTETKLHFTRSEKRATTTLCPSDSTVKEAKASVSIALNPLPYNLGCFLVVRLIGKGGMGYVHSAIDLRNTAQVAVKVMRRIDPWSVFRFIEEFTRLSQLSHPNLVKLYDAFSEGDIRYFSMELVEGKTVRPWFQKLSQVDADRQPEWRWNQARRVFAQAASALHFLHEQRVIHCDIKCSNLMITSRRRAVLLDLGLAVREGNSQPLVGTLQYMAPEVLEGGNPSRNSDWYSFGIMMYEVLTDRLPPIHVDQCADSQAKHYHINEEELHQELAGCPDDLTQLCCSLLKVNPGDRPQGTTILQTLGGSNNWVGFATPYQQFAGREKTIDWLNHACEHCARSGIVLLRGASGIGKTSLLQNWLGQHESRNHLTLSLRCFRQDHTPLRLLNLLIQELVQVLKYQPKSLWSETLEPQLDDIAAAFPQIRQLCDPDFALSTRPKTALPSYVVKSRGIQSLAQWLTELSKVQRLLLVIDDAQWADAESLQIIADLICADEFLGFVLIVDEGTPSVVEETIRNELLKHRPQHIASLWSTLGVGPLDGESCVQLLMGWAQAAAIEVSPAIARSIVTQSEGSPFLLQEMFRAYAHYTRRDGISEDQWLNTDPQTNVRRRFSLLPIQSENVLQYLAVAGQSIRFHQLQMVSRILPIELQRTLSLLASQGWVRSRGHDLDSDVEIAHDQFRRVILSSLPKDRLHRRHFRMARMLSSDVPPPWSRMADHYRAADRNREASACYLEAARAAIRTSDFGNALTLLEYASHEEADRDHKEQAIVTRLKADSLSGFGSSTAAAELYDALAVNLGHTNDNRLLMQCFSGEQWVRAGQLDMGLSRLREVLNRLGITNWKHTVLSQFCLRCRTLGIALGKLSTTLPVAKETDPPFTLMEQCLAQLSIPLTFLDNQLGPDLIIRLKRLAEKHGSHTDRALSQLYWAILLSFAGRWWRRRAMCSISLGRRHARQSAVPLARATVHLCLYIWYTQKGKILLGERHALSAIDWFLREPRKLQWEIQFLYWGLLGGYWYQGRLAELSRHTNLLRQSAIDRSDSMALYWMNVASAHSSDLVTDDIQRARKAISIASDAIANQSFQSPRFFLWLSSIQQSLYEAQPAKAFAILQQDWGNLDKAFVLSTNHYRWLALSLRLCCNLCCIRDLPSQRKAHLRDARRCLRQMAKLQELPFVTSGQAFALVVNAATGRIAAPLQWQATIDRLRSFGLHLLANALQWHMSLYAEVKDREQLCHQVEQKFRLEGCVAPERLLDTVLPLPSHGRL